MITARISFKELEDELRRRAKRVARAVAEEAKDIIADNSYAGVDILERRMADYTPAYKKVRRKLGLSTSPVNLEVTGSLLHRRRIRANDTESSLAVTGADEKKAQGIMLKRKPYPETDADTVKMIPRIVRAGEIVMSDR